MSAGTWETRLPADSSPNASCLVPINIKLEPLQRRSRRSSLEAPCLALPRAEAVFSFWTRVYTFT